MIGSALTGKGRKVKGDDMKIIKHGNALLFICENCECEWQEVKKNCEYESYSSEYWYRCPECGKRTKGCKVKAEDILPEEGR